MASDIDIAYQPDPTKLRLLKFNSPDILINGNIITQQSDGFISNLSLYDIITSIDFTVYAVDALTGKEASLTDTEYTYTINYSIIPSLAVLPTGLSGSAYPSDLSNNDYGNYIIEGSISALSSEMYEFLIRATLTAYDKDGNFVRYDDTDLYCYFTSSISSSEFSWNQVWLEGLTSSTIDGSSSTVYNLGVFPRGTSFTENMLISNINSYTVTYELVSAYDIDNNNPNDLTVPEGLHIDEIGRLAGIISASNTPGLYYFSVKVTDVDDTSNTGYPPTEQTIFSIQVLETIVTDNSDSSTITWITPSGYLGSIYESYPSYFAVEASNPSGLAVTYSLSPESNQLPNGLTIDPTTGMIIGNCPYVNGSTSYNILIRATVGTASSDRSFSFVILPLFESSDVFGLDIPVTGSLRQQIAEYSWQTAYIPEKYIYRAGDPNYGRPRNQNMYFLFGLTNTLDALGYWDDSLSPSDPNYGKAVALPTTNYSTYRSCLLDKLRNYHHPYDLLITGAKTSPGYSPDGVYLYDVIYLTLTDNATSVGGFDSTGTEQLITDTKLAVDDEIPQWNMPAGSTRICPASISNCRNDLIQTANRINSPTYMIRPNPKSGIGISGSEGLPLWMMTQTVAGDNTSVLGFTPSIVLCYCQPNTGQLVLNNLLTNGMSSLFGNTFTVDRYILKVNDIGEIHFDVTDVETTFDCIVDISGNINLNSGTWFDVVVTSNNNVIKFPPGDNYGF